MKRYVKEFLLRGMMFGGLGPVIAGIIYAILENTVENFVLTGSQACLGIVSTYILAFVHAGASVFNQIEHWSLAKSLFCHLGTLYLSYVACYLMNRWIPFEPIVLVIFTAAFVGGYFVIWLTVFAITKNVGKKLNSMIN